MSSNPPLTRTRNTDSQRDDSPPQHLPESSAFPAARHAKHFYGGSGSGSSSSKRGACQADAARLWHPRPAPERHLENPYRHEHDLLHEHDLHEHDLLHEHEHKHEHKHGIEATRCHGEHDGTTSTDRRQQAPLPSQCLVLGGSDRQAADLLRRSTSPHENKVDDDSPGQEPRPRPRPKYGDGLVDTLSACSLYGQPAALSRPNKPSHAAALGPRKACQTAHHREHDSHGSDNGQPDDEPAPPPPEEAGLLDPPAALLPAADDGAETGHGLLERQACR
ncbi:hypothetical protein HYQ44_009736 [Verticillium longisporum]|nr:hypothetical protein HYQ44_009736 [Verticillium longisporum]